jgi:hypothetical protein
MAMTETAMTEKVMTNGDQIMNPMPKEQRFKRQFDSWVQMEFDLMIHTRQNDLQLGAFTPADGDRLRMWVRAIAGGFNLGQFPFRVVAQVLHDLIERDHKQLASWLYSATLATVMASRSKTHKAVMCQVRSALPQLIA